jgi:hypothetical protein
LPLDVLPRSAVLGEEVFFLLELVYAGRTFRFATIPLTIESDDGDLEYDGGLDEVTWEEDIDIGATSPGEASVSLSVVFSDVDVAELVALGHDLGAATAELSRWVTGTVYEDRQVLITSRLSEPTYGAEQEPVSFSLVSGPYEDQTTVPESDEVVDEVSWPNAPDRALGKFYPRIIGAVGRIGTSQVPASPAVPIYDANRRLLVAGHATKAGSVYICNATVDPTVFVNIPLDSSIAAAPVTDGRGRRVETVTIALADWSPGYEYWAAWPDEGGIPGKREQGATSAGDVLDYLLDLTGQRVDQGRTAAAAKLLRGFEIAGYIDEPCNLWEWLQANLLPLLPVSVHTGPDGLYPIVWRYEATAEDAVAQIDIDRGDGDRDGDVEYTDADDVRNEITLRWGLDAFADEFTRATTLTGNDRISRSSRRFTNHIARVSRARYGPRSEVIETDLVYDEATAAAIVSWMAAAFALPSRILTYDLLPEFRHLELGDVVTLTDAELHLDAQVCLVVGLTDADTGLVSVTLRTLER